MESLLQPGRQFRPEEIIDELQGHLEVPEKPIASGGFANIYQGSWTDQYGARTEVAIKEIRPPVASAGQSTMDAEDVQRKRIGRELFIWNQTKHHNLHPLIGYQSQPRPRLICPWARHGNLTNYLQNNPGLSRVEKLLLIYQTGLGLCHLHSQQPPICHADIKPENVLINDTCEAALCDFGISRILQDNKSGFTTSATAKGTMAYMAPELFLDEKTSLSSDVYAFGGLILKVMTGKAPFYSATNQDFVFAQVVKGQLPDPQAYPELPITDPLWKLMRRCWAQAPDARPTMQAVLAEVSMHIQSSAPHHLATRSELLAAGTGSTLDNTVTLQPQDRDHSKHALLVRAVLGLMQLWLEATPVLQHLWRFMQLWLIRDTMVAENTVHTQTSSTAHLTYTSVSASTITSGGTVSSTQTIGSTVDMAAVVEKILDGLESKLGVIGPVRGYIEALINVGRDLIRMTQTSDGDTESLRELVLGTWRLAGLVEDLQDKLELQAQELCQVLSGIMSELIRLRDAVNAQRWFCQEVSSRELALLVVEEIEFLVRLDAERLLDEAASIKIQDERRQLLSALGGGMHGVQGTSIEEALCLPGTRVDVLNQVDYWIRSSEINDRALWIRGMAGRGKSTIATTIMQRWKYRAPCAIFHFRRGQTSLDAFVVCSLAKQLGNSVVTKVREAITDSVRRHPDIAGERLDEQFKTLVVAPLRGEKSGGLPVLMVIDGLDECDNPQHVMELFRLIDRHSPSMPTHIKFLFTSRPEDEITRAIETKPWRVVNLDSLGAIYYDLQLFIQHGCERIRIEHGLPEHWPSLAEVAQLVEMSQGLFQWARTALAFIGKRAPKARLRDLLTRTSAWNGLADLYHQILEQAFADLDSESRELLREILGIMVIAPHPISLDIIASLLAGNPVFSELNHDSSIRLLKDETLADMNSLILIPRSATEPVRLLHTSIRDFFLDRQRCDGRVYQIDITLEHEKMANLCLGLMFNHLKQNICSITSLSTSNSQIQEVVDKEVSHALRYCCRAWAVHFTDGIRGLESVADDGNTTWTNFVAFTKGKLLCWLEVMSLVGAVPEAITLSERIHHWLTTSSIKYKETDQLVSLWYDVVRFIPMFLDPISFSPTHIYVSALLHCPEGTALWEQYGSQTQLRTLQSVKSLTWSANMWTRVTGSQVNAVAVSPDGKVLASGTGEHMVHLWDAQSGTLLGEPLAGHTSGVMSVTFSPDGKILASGSSDDTVRLWDVQKRTALRGPLEGHTGSVSSLAFSPDGKILASGSHDFSILLWDVQSTTALREPLKGHGNRVNSVAFSPDGTTLASCADDDTIRLWSLQTGTSLGDALQDCGGYVRSIAFSPDGGTLASGSADCEVRLWNVRSGKPLRAPLRGHTDWVRSVAFAPDGQTIASASDDGTIQLWDVKSGELVRDQLEGQHGWIYSVAFVNDGRTLVSGSRGGAVQLWDIQGETRSITPSTERGDSITAVAFSPDGKLIAASSDNHKICLWDVQSGKPLRELLQGHTGTISSCAFSPDGKVLSSGSYDCSIRLWDVESGSMLREPLVGHTDWVRSVAFSPDGKTLVSGSDDCTIRMWDVQTGASLRDSMIGHSRYVASVAFSPDGKALASGSYDNTIQLWDVHTGETFRGPLEGHSDWVYSVAFSPDGRTLASGSDDGTVRLWDVQSGASLRDPLSKHARAIRSVVFAHDGRTLASASVDGRTRLWDADDRGPLNDPPTGQILGGASIQASPDEKALTSDPKECTIRVGDVQNSTEPDVQGRILASSTNGAEGASSSQGSATVSPVQSQPTRFSPGQLSFDGSWITVMGNHLLWLPPEYRAQINLEAFPNVYIAHRTILIVLRDRICFFKLPHEDPFLFSPSPVPI